ncbi:two-component sensor histidine kinase, partial [Cellulosimicrobium cellulans]|nr:two-component sensor histidine kinase [Cellulosimicrobium cellulans]
APDGDAREHRGLAGMRERARLLRGEVAAGPAPDGGAWVVRATFPRAGSSR